MTGAWSGWPSTGAGSAREWSTDRPGPNGSGKTTTFNLLTGVIRPDDGQVIYKGENIAGLKPHQVFSKRITRTLQVTRVFREMTVLENMFSGASWPADHERPRMRTALWLHQRQALTPFVSLDAPRNQAARELGLPV